MKRRFYTLIGLILMIGISEYFTSCSKENSVEQNEYIQSKMAEIENAILLRQLDASPVSLKIYNESYFIKIKELKLTSSDFERNRIKDELSSYDLKTCKFSSQTKNDNPQLTNLEAIIYESFSKSINNSERNSIATCDLYINEVTCLTIDDKVKRDFVDRITFFRDLLIFADYETYWTKVSYDIDKKSLTTEFDDCYDECMISEIKAATSSTLRTVFFLLHMPFKAAEIAVVCIGDCI